MLLNEIFMIDPADFPGDESEIGGLKFSDKREKNAYEKRRALPGGSGLEWFAMKDPNEARFFITDPEMKVKDEDDIPVIGRLVVNQWNRDQPGGGVWTVDSVGVLPEYRGKKIGLALYGIALTIFKIHLASGEAQTPNGRKMWSDISSVPGVKIGMLVRRVRKFVSDRNFTEKGLELLKSFPDDGTAYEKMVKKVGGKEFETDNQFYIVPVKMKNGVAQNDYFKVYGTAGIVLVAKKD